MKKKILSALLCATLAVSSMICANATEVKDDKVFQVLGEEIYVENNTLVGYTYNVDEDYNVRVKYESDENEYYIKFVECIDTPSVVRIPNTEECSYMLYRDGTGVGTGAKFSLANAGGKYTKVRVKLSDFFEYFNEDGSINGYSSKEMCTYSFDKIDGKYKSIMVISSGLSLVQGVVPDENGEIEIYLPQTVGRFVKCCAMGRDENTLVNHIERTLYSFYFGNVDGESYVDVKDVTALQLYLAGVKELDEIGRFHADVNCDKIYDVRDVTALQIGILKQE